MSFKTHLDVPFRVHNTVESGLLGDHGITAFSFYEDDVSEPFLSPREVRRDTALFRARACAHWQLGHGDGLLGAMPSVKP